MNLMEDIKMSIIKNDLKIYKEIVEKNKENIKFIKSIYNYINAELLKKNICEENFIYSFSIFL